MEDLPVAQIVGRRPRRAVWRLMVMVLMAVVKTTACQLPKSHAIVSARTDTERCPDKRGEVVNGVPRILDSPAYARSFKPSTI